MLFPQFQVCHNPHLLQRFFYNKTPLVYSLLEMHYFSHITGCQQPCPCNDGACVLQDGWLTPDFPLFRMDRQCARPPEEKKKKKKTFPQLFFSGKELGRKFRSQKRDTISILLLGSSTKWQILVFFFSLYYQDKGIFL